MHTYEASRLARSLLNEHGLGRVAFEFDNAKRRFGRCSFNRFTGDPTKISLSEPLTKINDEPKVRQVILHEIAHALAGHEAAHGPEFRAMCRKLGIPGDRCYSTEDTETIKGNIHAMCLECKETVARFHRMPKRGYICPKHRTRLVMRRVG